MANRAFAINRVPVIAITKGRTASVIHVFGHPYIRTELDCLVIPSGSEIVQHAPDDCRGSHPRNESFSDSGRIHTVIDIEVVNRRTGQIDLVTTGRATVPAASAQEEGKN